MLGMNPDFKPKFAKRFADVGTQIVRATEAYVSEVRDRSFPAVEHAFKPNGFRNPDGDGDAPTAEPHWQTN
jgi:3-methyl-2-oxobutanoate hydroxymethyltransferase